MVPGPGTKSQINILILLNKIIFSFLCPYLCPLSRRLLLRHRTKAMSGFTKSLTLIAFALTQQKTHRICIEIWNEKRLRFHVTLL